MNAGESVDLMGEGAKGVGENKTQRTEGEVKHAYRASSPVASLELVLMPVKERGRGRRNLFYPFLLPHIMALTSS
jgi:hypothetical protein